MVGGFVLVLRFISWGFQCRASSGQQDGTIVLRYDDIGDVLYEPFTIVTAPGGTDCAVIETFVEERPVD